MREALPSFILVARTPKHAHLFLRDLTIPPHPFLRTVRLLPIDSRSLDPIRGLVMPWAAVPETDLPSGIEVHMAAQRCRAIDVHEAVARHLAWRIWHDC